METEMIYATIDVELMDHPRALAAAEQDPAALALWLWGMLWCKAQKSDGELPRVVVLRCPWLQGRAHGEKLARTLCDPEVGLWVSTETGWTIRNYLKKQESRAQTEARLKSDRQRKRGLIPSGFRPDSVRIPPAGGERNPADSLRREEKRREETRLVGLRSDPEGEREGEGPSGVIALIPESLTARLMEVYETLAQSRCSLLYDENADRLWELYRASRLGSGRAVVDVTHDWHAWLLKWHDTELRSRRRNAGRRTAERSQGEPVEMAEAYKPWKEPGWMKEKKR